MHADQCTDPECGIDYPHRHRVPDNRHTAMVAAELPPRPSPRCTFCGKDEGDDIGPVVAGACPECTRAWA